ncbi:trypsin-like peptidase domain-containing protein [Altererythrobacter sp. H2]|uniref:S1C family serine protease n=1 Tax=Altererythrobacter sp. H2 TaxID=3108391 RepID=UPI002B4C0D24|nr:trypsin-like peptidase domain-containing protein [Altererythrobacter sp. H2]WRK97260.1 trypsin-like peptidase domain-containing protein [Altererythrobacter sp. H2]
MNRCLAALALLIGLFLPSLAQADPADIDAAARGVVRVVIMGSDGEEIIPLSHGTGFAVSPRRIVTNAHVVQAAAMDDSLRIGVVPAEGDEAVFGRIIAVSPRNDLALVELTGSLRLPPLTIAGNASRDSGDAIAVGYPMNVDRAQGLEIGDIFRSQPPVKSRGALAGSRPSRQFDTLLHTAAIARGNSGGPLLDPCGRVLGVNSFGAEGDASDAEFFFAVSNRELLPFLEANGVTAQVNDLPCRSLSELDEAEQARLAREEAESRQQLDASRDEVRERRDRARLEESAEVQTERENTMALAFLLVLVAAGSGTLAWRARTADRETDPGAERRMMVAGTIAAIAAVTAAALWFTRPGLDEVDRRVEARLAAPDAGENPAGSASAPEGTLLCTLDLARSRVTGAPDRELEFGWQDDGCVNGRTQYGLAAGEWARVFVPNDDDAVSVSRFDPDGMTYRTDRYLLGRTAMTAARKARSQYEPPSCGSAGAAARLGDLQGSVTAQLPDQPNERLVYSCTAAGN